jgi:hypothetical protein
MMRWALRAIGALILSATAFATSSVNGASLWSSLQAVQPAVVAGFNTMPIGGGGFTMDVVIAADGTKIARMDTFGLWWLNPTMTCGNNGQSGCWQQMVTSTTMPAGAFGSLTSGGCARRGCSTATSIPKRTTARCGWTR